MVTVSLMRNTVFARPSEFMPKDKKTLGKNGGIKNEILRLLLFMH